MYDTILLEIYRWRKIMKQWVKNSVIYQIYPRSFQDSNNDGIGDIPGIISRLDYLQQLGVDMIWLSPIYDSPLVDNGYDISNYYDLLPDYGTMDDFKTLVSELHRRGMRLVMDLVINHTSNEHPWFIESAKSVDNPYRNFYHWQKGKGRKKPNNWMSLFGGSAWEYDEKTQEYYLHIFAKEQPDLNWECKELRAEIKKMLRFWLDLGVDGFRCDVINLLSKTPGYPNGKLHLIRGHEHFINGPQIHKYLKELKKEVFDQYDTFTVGEAIFLKPEDALSYISFDNQELTMVFQFDHMSADNIFKWFFRPYKPRRLMNALTKWQDAINGKGWNTLYWENHDQPRVINRFGDTENYRFQSATMLAIVLYFQQGTPFIYQGQEIGMTNPGFTELSDYQDIETHRIYRLGRRLGLSHKRMMKKIMYMSRDNARTPMQWDDSENAGFSKGKPWIKVNSDYKTVNVKNSLADPKSIFYFYQKIIALRKQLTIIVEGTFKELLPKHKYIYCYLREYEGKKLLVVGNLSDKTRELPIPKDIDITKGKLILQNYPEISPMLQAYEARVYLFE